MSDEFSVEWLCWKFGHSFIDHETRLRLDDFENEGEKPYSAGMCNQAESVLEDIQAQGVDVVEAAEDYAEEEDLRLVPVWVDDYDIDVDFRKQSVGFTTRPEVEE